MRCGIVLAPPHISLRGWVRGWSGGFGRDAVQLRDDIARQDDLGRRQIFLPINSPTSENSADHTPDQANWTANTTSVTMNATAATGGRMVAIGFVDSARVRRRDVFG